MFRKLVCLVMCLLLALGALPAPSAAWAESAAQLYDFNGDGQSEELRCHAADTALTLQVGQAAYTVDLNNFSDTYVLAIADLDASDAFMEIVVGNEGNSGEYPVSTTWQILRYDGSRLYPLTVVTDADEADTLTQYGHAGNSMIPLKVSGDGDVYVPSSGVIWIQPLMWDQEYAAYEEHYRLEGDRLVLQVSDQFYPVVLQETRASAGDAPAYAAATALALYATPDRAGEVITIPAGTLLTPTEATPSGWLRLRAANTEGYIWQEPGWNECLDANGQVFSDVVERLASSPTPLMPSATPGSALSIEPAAIGLGSIGEGYVTLEQVRADFYTGRNRFVDDIELVYDRILADPENYFMCLTAKETVGEWQSTAAMYYNYIVNGELQDIAEAAQEGMFEKLVLLDVLSAYTDICYQDSESFDMVVDAFKEFVNVSGSVDDLLETLADMDGVLPEAFNPAVASLFISLYEEGEDWANALTNYLRIYAQRQQYIELLQSIRATNPDEYMTKAIDEIIAALSNESLWVSTSDIYLQAGDNITSTIVLTAAEEALALAPQVKAVLAARKLTGTVINTFFDFSEFTVQMRTAEVLRSYETALVEVAKQVNAEYLRDPSQENALRVCAMFDIVYRSLLYDLDTYTLISDVFRLSEASQNLADMREAILSSYEAVQSMDYELMRDRQNNVNDVSTAPETQAPTAAPSDIWQESPGTTPIAETVPDADPAVTWWDDFDKDGVEEMFYLSGESYNTLLGAVVHSELWYSGSSGTTMLARTGAETFSDGRVFDVGERKLFCIEEITSAGNASSVWTVYDGVARQVELSLESWLGDMRIAGIQQDSEQDFSFLCEDYDAGHIWKPYYMYWNGNGFTEYGGLRISEEQLRAVEGASRWLDKILSVEGMIGDILYRENGIVNINYTTTDSWTDGTVNNNATLRIEDDMAQLVYDREETLQDSNIGGTYAANVLDDVSFPDVFPYATTEASSNLPSGYQQLAERYADLDGDGAEECLSFCHVSDGYGDARIALCVFRTTGEMIHTFDLQTYTPYSNYVIRAYLVSEEERQRVFLESISFDGAVHSKYYSLLGYDNGGCSEETTVRDYGFSDSTALYGVFVPEGEETELFYDAMAYSPADCQDEYLGCVYTRQVI